MALGDALTKKVDATAEEWRSHGNIRKLWQRDKSLWTGTDEDRWLGWLDSRRADQIKSYQAFAEEIRRDGFTDALLLGMGGSSLGPEVLATMFGHKAGFPRLRILDSTVPAQIKAIESTLDLGKTLFIVSSKSGSTTEPNIFKDYFFKRVADTVGADKAGRHFVAITDPGSALEQTAKAQNFRKIFFGVPSIGGRYSVLSPFGLVPAAIAGIDVAALEKSARLMMHSCGPDVPPSENPGVALGLALGAAARAGRDKVTILTSPRLADFGAWAEQLFAESTGKNGKGLIPIDGEPLGAAASLRRRSFLHRSHARWRSRCRTRGQACEAARGRPSGGPHRARNRSNISARNFSASRSPRRSPARSSASIRSISPTSKRARSRPAS